MIAESQHEITVSRSAEPLEDEPGAAQISSWLKTALAELAVHRVEVSLRIVSEQEMTELNGNYRGRSEPTNVLSFPAGVEIDGAPLFLGDIAVCSAVVLRESIRYNKPFKARFAHMIVHGLLHLLGYDHTESTDRSIMEALEVKLLSTLGVLDPYEMEPVS